MNFQKVAIPKVLREAKQFFSTASHSRTLATLSLLLLVAVVPLTVYVGQQNQENRSRADVGESCTESKDCPAGKYGKITCTGIYSFDGTCSENVTCDESSCSDTKPEGPSQSDCASASNVSECMSKCATNYGDGVNDYCNSNFGDQPPAENITPANECDTNDQCSQGKVCRSNKCVDSGGPRGGNSDSRGTCEPRTYPDNCTTNDGKPGVYVVTEYKWTKTDEICKPYTNTECQTTNSENNTCQTNEDCNKNLDTSCSLAFCTESKTCSTSYASNETPCGSGGTCDGKGSCEQSSTENNPSIDQNSPLCNFLGCQNGKICFSWIPTTDHCIAVPGGTTNTPSQPNTSRPGPEKRAECVDDPITCFCTDNLNLCTKNEGDPLGRSLPNDGEATNRMAQYCLDNPQLHGVCDEVRTEPNTSTPNVPSQGNGGLCVQLPFGAQPLCLPGTGGSQNGGGSGNTNNGGGSSGGGGGSTSGGGKSGGGTNQPAAWKCDPSKYGTDGQIACNGFDVCKDILSKGNPDCDKNYGTGSKYQQITKDYTDFQKKSSGSSQTANSATCAVTTSSTPQDPNRVTYIGLGGTVRLWTRAKTPVQDPANTIWPFKGVQTYGNSPAYELDECSGSQYPPCGNTFNVSVPTGDYTFFCDVTNTPNECSGDTSSGKKACSPQNSKALSVSQTSLAGVFQEASCQSLKGWVRNPQDTTSNVRVEFVVSKSSTNNKDLTQDQSLGQVSANTPRSDLTFTDKNHGFVFTIPDEVKKSIFSKKRDVTAVAVQEKEGKTITATLGTQTVTCGTAAASGGTNAAEGIPQDQVEFYLQQIGGH